MFAHANPIRSAYERARRCRELLAMARGTLTSCTDDHLQAVVAELARETERGACSLRRALWRALLLEHRRLTGLQAWRGAARAEQLREKLTVTR